ncbi:MAG: FkbM family methyltransferase, partial [Sulfolobaceae archaeon]
MVNRLLIIFLKKTHTYNIADRIHKGYIKIRKKRIYRKSIRDIEKNGRFAKINLFGMNFILDKKSLHDYNMYLELSRGNLYEVGTTNYIRNTLKKGSVFIDLGSSNGYYTLIASKCVGNEGKVISIEANPETYKRLLNNISENKLDNVLTYNIAISDYDGEANIFLNPGDEDGLASIINKTEKYMVNKIKCYKISTILNDLNINKVDILKMDVEGSEINVLRGMDNIKIDKIIMEFNKDYLGTKDFNYLKERYKISLLGD